MKAAIRASNLSKQYSQGTGPRGQYWTLREGLTNALSASWHRLRQVRSPRKTAAKQTFFALRGVSFEIESGEVVGVMGRNGAGKSTLLKILSRVTEPSEGRAELRGRIGSLLEVGTGFHPELTGRENIFLNGAILGMTRREIWRRFDDIVAFAEIESFLDMPVKRYSSGMYVRLAFAVAAHLEPEILVVDEVLAVGDVSFQKKCLDKMQDVGRQGSTVLFVSHNLAVLRALCRRGLVLKKGELVADGPITSAVSEYLKGLETTATTDLSERVDRSGAGQVRFRRVDIRADGEKEPGTLVMGQAAQFAFQLSGLMPGLSCIFTVFDSYGCSITRFNSGLGSLDDRCEHTGPEFQCSVDELLLAPGRYRVDVALQASGELQDCVEAAAFFEVRRGAVRGREVPRVEGDWKLCLPHRWHAPQ